MNKRLSRSTDHRVLGGVCGGMGEYFEIDPIIFRSIFIALILAGGGSIIIYMILLIVIPRESIVQVDQQSGDKQKFDTFQKNDFQPGETENSTKMVIGLLLVATGVFVLLNNLVPLFKLKKLWPAILLIIGLGLLFQKGNKKNGNSENK